MSANDRSQINECSFFTKDSTNQIDRNYFRIKPCKMWFIFPDLCCVIFVSILNWLIFLSKSTPSWFWITIPHYVREWIRWNVKRHVKYIWNMCGWAQLLVKYMAATYSEGIFSLNLQKGIGSPIFLHPEHEKFCLYPLEQDFKVKSHW